MYLSKSDKADEIHKWKNLFSFVDNELVGRFIPSNTRIYNINISVEMPFSNRQTAERKNGKTFLNRHWLQWGRSSNATSVDNHLCGFQQCAVVGVCWQNSIVPHIVHFTWCLPTKRHNAHCTRLLYLYTLVIWWRIPVAYKTRVHTKALFTLPKWLLSFYSEINLCSSFTHTPHTHTPFAIYLPQESADKNTFPHIRTLHTIYRECARKPKNKHQSIRLY